MLLAGSRCHRLNAVRQNTALGRPRRGRGALRIHNAMFDNLSQGLTKAWDLIQGDSKLNPENIKAPIREVRR